MPAKTMRFDLSDEQIREAVLSVLPLDDSEYVNDSALQHFTLYRRGPRWVATFSALKGDG